MRAVLQGGYGQPEDVLALGDAPVPTPADDEVLIRVHASGVHPDVWHVVSGLPRMLRLANGRLRPRQPIPGTDLAGTVEEVGASVTRFSVGDAVFGEAIRGYQWQNGGAWAEFATAPASLLAPVPAGVDLGVAGSIPTAGLIVLENLPADLDDTWRVLVNGAAGGVGSIAVQLAHAAGAEVTGVDAGEHLDRVTALGADHVIDYTVDDFTKRAERYDLVFDIPGNHPYRAIAPVLTDRGVYVLIGHDGYGKANHVVGSAPRMVGLMVRSLRDHHIPKGSVRPDKAAGMARLATALESGALAPTVTRRFGLGEAGRALRELVDGTAGGRIVITPQGEE